MEYTPQRILELIRNIDWKERDILRIFWVRYSSGARADLANSLKTVVEGEAIVPLVVRGSNFVSANAVLADVNEIFQENESEFERLREVPVQRVTVLLLAKNDFGLPQGSSPIELPTWFPVLPGEVSSFHISDLGLAAEERMLDCPEARIEHVSALVYQLETVLLAQLDLLLVSDRAALQKFLDTAHAGTVGDVGDCLDKYRRHLAAVLEPRGYRPNAAADSKSLVSRLLKLTLNSSPKQLGSCAKTFAQCLKHLPGVDLKPTFFAVMLRPAAKMDTATANWYSIMLAFYQAYQLMNAAAHGGEYPKYSVALQYANSLNLRTFLADAGNYLHPPV